MLNPINAQDTVADLKEACCGALRVDGAYTGGCGTKPKSLITPSCWRWEREADAFPSVDKVKGSTEPARSVHLKRQGHIPGSSAEVFTKALVALNRTPPYRGDPIERAKPSARCDPIWTGGDDICGECEGLKSNARFRSRLLKNLRAFKKLRWSHRELNRRLAPDPAH